MSYDNETPINDKFLTADGSIRNSNGQIIQSANEYWKKQYEQATPIPLKFLHADGTIDENIGGTPIKYHLYAWDYGNGFCVGYTEKEIPVAGDLLFLKQDMEEGVITDPTELKMIYHVVSDSDGVITVSEHPEGQSGYTFTRNPDDDYEETILDVRDIVDVTQNGLLITQKGTVFKSANIKVEKTLYAYSNGTSTYVYTNNDDKKFNIGDKYMQINGSGNVSVYTLNTDSDVETLLNYLNTCIREPSKDFTF